MLIYFINIKKCDIIKNPFNTLCCYTNIGEIATGDIAREEHPQRLKENLNVAKR